MQTTMTCQNCSGEFEISYFNALIHAYINESFLRWVEITCHWCTYEYKFFISISHDEELTEAGIKRVVVEYPTDQVRAAFNRTFYPHLTEEDEEVVMQFIDELETSRVEDI